MKASVRSLGIALAASLASLVSDAQAQGKVKVMSDGPLAPALVQVAEGFRREAGTQVEFVFGTSPVVHKKVVEGETADVLIIQPSFLAELVKAGKVLQGEHPVVGRVGFGLAVRTGVPARDISTTEAFRQALLSADSLVFNNVASGNYFATVLARLGIADAVKAKVIRAEPAAVFERVIQGKGNDIGVGTIPLINTTKGLQLLGPLPAEVQSYIVYAAAQMTSSASPHAGRAFLNFLSGPAAKPALAANGVE
jgi:molybdate transport system substrate-binding protein